MNGFYITINNGLLYDGHRKRMGSAVWEFMWLLDKITSISEEGIGLVLGGRPIKIEEITKDLQITRKHVGLHLTRLSEEGYISTLRTPYGLVIKVHKAKKIFNQKPDVTKTTHLYTKNDTSLSKNDTSNIRQDNIQDNKIDSSTSSNELAVFIETFNRLFTTSYRITPNRTKQLKIRMKTYSLQEILKAVENCASSKFHQGMNDRGWKASPDYILRSDEKIDEFMNKTGKESTREFELSEGYKIYKA